MKELYQLRTGDTAAHQRRIDGHLRQLDARRQRVIRARIAGETLRTIAAREGLSVGTTQKLIDRGIELIRKAIAGEPRRQNRKTSGTDHQPTAA
jgi:DNA-directed RNA polymerase specialized sigma24 family protein